VTPNEKFSLSHEKSDTNRKVFLENVSAWLFFISGHFLLFTNNSKKQRFFCENLTMSAVAAKPEKNQCRDADESRRYRRNAGMYREKSAQAFS
jgi:hypothetical protein